MVRIISLFEIHDYSEDWNDCYLVQKFAWIQRKGQSWKVSFIYWKFMVQYLFLEAQIKRMNYKKRGQKIISFGYGWLFLSTFHFWSTIDRWLGFDSWIFLDLFCKHLIKWFIIIHHTWLVSWLCQMLISNKFYLPSRFTSMACSSLSTVASSWFFHQNGHFATGKKEDQVKPSYYEVKSSKSHGKVIKKLKET